MDSSHEDKPGSQENPGQGDQWKSLLDDLGVDASDDATKQPPPKPVATPEPIVSDSTAVPERPASGWNTLLDDFGIDAPAAPAESTEPAESAGPDEPVGRAEASPEFDDTPSQEPETYASQDATNEPAEIVENIWNDLESAAHNVDDEFTERDDSDVTQLEQMDEEDATLRESPASAGQDEEPEPLPELKKPAGGFAGKARTTLPDWFPFAGRKSKTPPPEPEPMEADAEALPAAGEASSEGERGDAEPSGASSGGTSEGESVDQKGDRGDGDRPPKRRRRRRRRGRGRSEGEATPIDAAIDATDEMASALEEEAGEELSDDSDHALAAVNGEDQEPTDEDNSTDGESGARRGRSRRSSARTVPSWGETIGVVVDANIAARATRKKTATRTGSRGGNGGGGRRPRGRRKKKSS